MTSYRFEVPGPPVPKGRPRVVRVKGRTMTFTPPETEGYERKVAFFARKAGVKPLEGEVDVELWFYLPTKRRVDVDNLAKSVLDGLNGIAWRDDAQVAHLSVTRVLGCKNPLCTIHIYKCAEVKQ